MIDITGLDKAEVLCALYQASRPLGMGMLHFTPGPLPIEEARAILKETTYIDYLKGRVMKVDLSGDQLDPWGFDRDNGTGAAWAALKPLLETGRP